MTAMPNSTMSIRSQLIEINEHIVKAEQSATPAEVEYLRTVLSDDLLFRRADGTIVDKVTFLNNVPLSAQRLTRRQPSDVEVHVRGQSALVTLTVTAL